MVHSFLADHLVVALNDRYIAAFVRPDGENSRDAALDEQLYRREVDSRSGEDYAVDRRFNEALDFAAGSSARNVVNDQDQVIAQRIQFVVNSLNQVWVKRVVQSSGNQPNQPLSFGTRRLRAP